MEENVEFVGEWELIPQERSPRVVEEVVVNLPSAECTRAASHGHFVEGARVIPQERTSRVEEGCGRFVA